MTKRVRLGDRSKRREGSRRPKRSTPPVRTQMQFAVTALAIAGAQELVEDFGFSEIQVNNWLQKTIRRAQNTRNGSGVSIFGSAPPEDESEIGALLNQIEVALVRLEELGRKGNELIRETTS